MKILAIASAEWLNKKLLFLSIPLAWLTIVIGPLLEGRSVSSASDAWPVIAVGIGFPLTALLGLIFGAGMFGPDIQEGRLGFYLAQPIRPAALFAGKLLGTILLVFSIGLLAMLPVLLLHLGKDEAWSALLPLAVVAIAMPLLGHALSIAFRARTPWLLLDLSGLGATVLVLLWFLRWMWVLSALHTATQSLGMLALLAVVVLGVAGCVQLAQGRTDLKLGHRWLSSIWVVFPVMAMAAMAIMQYRTLNVSVSSIRSVFDAAALGNGPWAKVVTGVEGDGPMANFLINTTTGKGIRLGNGTFVTALNGKRAGWLQPPAPGGARGTSEFWVLDLAPGGYVLRPTGIQATEAYGPMALDAEGHRLAVLEERTLSVYNVDSGLLLARAPREADPHAYIRLVFLNADHLRTYVRSQGGDGKATLIGELDIPSGRFKPVGTLAEGRILERNPQADSLLVRNGPLGSGGLDLVNAQTGALLTSLVPPGEAWALDALFLRNGSIAVAALGPKGLRVLLCGPHGQSLSVNQIPGVFPTAKVQTEYPWIGEETAPGKIQLGFHATPEAHHSRTVEVDLATGSCLPLPARIERWGFSLARRQLLGPGEAGSLASRLWIANDHGLEIQDTDGRIRRLTAAPTRRP